MAASSVVAEAILEDKIADIFSWTIPICLHDVRSPDVKTRELREIAVVKIAEKRSEHIVICFIQTLRPVPMPCQNHHKQQQPDL